MFPVLLNLTGKRLAVIGGGAVGRRKALAALGGGAAVRIVDPVPRPPGFDRPHLEWISERYRSDHLIGAVLVFACATPEVNEAVLSDARAIGAWVNCATQPDAGDFVLPAAFAAGGLTVAVGTGGAAPALARRVRDKLAGQFDPAYAEWVSVLGRVRRVVLGTVADERVRRELLDQFADWPWLERIRREGAEVVLAAMTEEAQRAAGRG